MDIHDYANKLNAVAWKHADAFDSYTLSKTQYETYVFSINHFVWKLSNNIETEEIAELLTEKAIDILTKNRIDDLVELEDLLAIRMMVYLDYVETPDEFLHVSILYTNIIASPIELDINPSTDFTEVIKFHWKMLRHLQKLNKYFQHILEGTSEL